MLDIKEIEKIIPQRAPFLMIDKVEEYVPGESAIAYKNVNINECKLQEDELEEVKYFKIEELQYLDNEGFEWLENLRKVI